MWVHDELLNWASGDLLRAGLCSGGEVVQDRGADVSVPPRDLVDGWHGVVEGFGLVVGEGFAQSVLFSTVP